MDHILLQLQRSPEQQTAVDALIDNLHNPKSPDYHHWLTAAEFGQRYGLAPQDLTTITGWLQFHGFTVNAVYTNGLLIDFSGNAGQIRQAFHTEIHALNVDGAPHIANMSDPQIPEALAAAIVGIVSMHDFRPHAMVKERTDYTFSSGGYVYEAVTPGDLATIYNLTPLFANGNSGGGADHRADRGRRSLQRPGLGHVPQYVWTVSVHCRIVDHRAPGGVVFRQQLRHAGTRGRRRRRGRARREMGQRRGPFRSHSTGLLRRYQNHLRRDDRDHESDQLGQSSHDREPMIVSLSYGECEAENGASANSAFSLAFQQAVAEGISVFVAAGDEGAASCDAGNVSATHGIGVGGFASTPYNVPVGGNDFGDSSLAANANYWSSSNGPNYTSALSYIPEIPWNDSCASALLANYFGGRIRWACPTAAVSAKACGRCGST